MLHRRSVGWFVFAAVAIAAHVAFRALAFEQHENGSETDENVHYPFDHGPRTEEPVHHVPGTIDADQSPVDSPDQDERHRNLMANAHVFHHKRNG